ncbi:MAG: hypothetical protein AAF513_06065 [Pseudomonadota bacterium]
MSGTGQREIVLLYDAEERIIDEFLYSRFARIVEGHDKLEAYAASHTKAVYCLVGNGLTLKNAVFFVLPITEEGVIDANFNLPLRYMAMHAGKVQGEDVRVASRSQCPVPWHAVHLWEPAAEDALDHLQGRILRNKLKLKTLVLDSVDSARGPHEVLEIPDTPHIGELPAENSTADNAQKLVDAFGEAGKLSLADLIRLHSDQIEQAQQRYRSELEQQQQTYLQQVRAAREEVQTLKVALRQEQDRNRRLQQMLRGDI